MRTGIVLGIFVFVLLVNSPVIARWLKAARRSRASPKVEPPPHMHA